MSKYNLIRNGVFSGSGDHIFTWSDLEKLQDGNTTTSGVTISGVNDLVIDLSQRIKVDGIRLYASDMSKSSNIHFYYKNETSDNYTLLSTSSGTYYSTTISEPSAPRYIKVTISGVSMDLYEFQVFNDDYIVAFGTDGQQYAEYLEDTPIGEEGSPQAVAIYNNSNLNMPADAYTCVEVTGSGYDNYIEISSSENGVYYAIEDGAVIEDNRLSSNYIWDMGEYDGTEANNNEVIITSRDVLGIDMGDLPLAYAAYSWYVGQNCWDYDPVSRTIYAIGSDGALKLYKYPIDDQVWTYVGEINPGCSSFTNYASMSYLNGYVYVIINCTGLFGRYDLSGPQDNWESLPSVGWVTANPTRFGMCGDKSRYIYTIHQYYPNDNYKQFRRYDTTTSGWVALNNGYDNNARNDGSDHRRACLSYDYDRDEIYADVGTQVVGNYIQRYVVSSDTWNTTWFNVDINTEAASDYNNDQTQSYYNGYLVLGHAQCGSKIYYMHIPTDTFGYFTSNVGGFYVGNYDTSTFESPYILVTDTPVSDVAYGTVTSGVTIWASQINADRGNLYKFGSYDLGVGSYTTPIVGLDNKYNSSYVTMYHDGRVSVSDSDVDSIEVRSSDIEPLAKDEIFWIVYDTQYRVYKYVVYNGEAIEPYISLPTAGVSTYSITVNRRNGNIGNVHGNAAYMQDVYIQIHDNDGNELYSKGADILNGTDFVCFDKSGGLWLSNYGSFLYHYDYELNVLFSDTFVDVYDLAAEMNDDGVWYTNSTDNTLVHKDTIGTVLGTVILNEPRAVCGTLDNGCWVIDNEDEKAYRYNSNSSRVQTVNIERTATRMSSDMENGFWYINGNYIYHVDSNGVEDVEVYVDQPAWVSGGHNGCVVTSTVHDTIKYIDKDSGSIIRSYDPGVIAGPAAMFSFRHEDYVEFKNTTNFIPTSYDPIWGTGGSLEWKTVSKTGYFLPKCRYHQFRITLRDTISENAALKQVILAPAVKTEDIQPGQSKNLYVRTNIPIGSDITDYEIKLRTWWGIEDN
jgi:hypothetical protein